MNEWSRAYKCKECKDARWIIFDKPMFELYGDMIPIPFAKPCPSCMADYGKKKEKSKDEQGYVKSRGDNS